MRVGILTFHSQVNYGGVLQAYALQTALEQAGYDVCVVDRWISPTNELLAGPHRAGPWRSRLAALMKGAFGLRAAWGRLRRHRRTEDFVRTHLRLTPEHFTEWTEPAAQRLPVDCLVVGSDQVWHGGTWGDPAPYLLEGAPEGVAAIAYAASFGMSELPPALTELYRRGIRRFSAISVREAEAVGLVERLGARAVHTADPTLLVDPAVWSAMASERPSERPILTVYLMAGDILPMLPKLRAFARLMGAEVRVLLGCAVYPFPRSVGGALRLLWSRLRWPFPSSVRLCLTAGPSEFLEALGQATWVLSDSFHALMFSAVFDKQVAILKPQEEMRRAMYGRIEEFLNAYTEGSVTAERVDEALGRFERGERMAFRREALRQCREASWAWLTTALDNVEHKRGKADTSCA